MDVSLAIFMLDGKGVSSRWQHTHSTRFSWLDLHAEPFQQPFNGEKKFFHATIKICQICDQKAKAGKRKGGR